MRTGLTFIKEEDGIKFYGEISATDMMAVKLDSVEQAMMDACVFDSPACDYLLVLETLFRRIGEQQK